MAGHDAAEQKEDLRQGFLELIIGAEARDDFEAVDALYRIWDACDRAADLGKLGELAMHMEEWCSRGLDED